MHLSRRTMMIGASCAVLGACGGEGTGGSNPPPPQPTPTPTPTPMPTPTPSPWPTLPPQVRVAFDFTTGAQGFTADFADYAPGMETGSEGIVFVSDVRRLPAPLDNRFGLLVGGTNRSDDLFLYIWREVTGLVPGQRYRVETEITFATNAVANCVGVGGAPGESVVVKAGASPVRPAKALTAQNYYKVNFDKDAGPLTVGGTQAFSIGDVAGGAGTCDARVYAIKTLRSAADRMPTLTADASGRLWIVIGTDSGFEARTEIYYLDGAVTFTPY